MSQRVGLGFDSHRIASGGQLILGGCIVGEGMHFVGHSDADVLLHAVTDSLLSAAGLPDIGELFPNTAEENRGRDSGERLSLAMHRVREAGFALVNLDAVVQLERPKLASMKLQIRTRIAQILGADVSRVNIKGKTGEGVGEIGRGELATAMCVVLLETAKEVA
ncbi:MAG: 2-C-methyl-D-erythritol 2,4-cyclodiphosphate synthase [Planctomycetota bacterium]